MLFSSWLLLLSASVLRLGRTSSACGVVQYEALPKVCVSHRPTRCASRGPNYPRNGESLCLLRNSFSFLGARVGHTKNRHTTLQPWSVSPVAPCSPGGQAERGAQRKGELTYIFIPRASIPFSDRRS